MGWLSFLTPDVGKTVKDATDGFGNLATKLRSAITGELPPKVRGEIEKVAVEAEALAMKTQGELTKIEASSKSIFLAGWRPALGWICVTGFLIHFIISPVMQWIAILLGKTISAPTLEVGALMSLVITLLGVGTMRTYEKKKNINNKH